MLIQWGAVVPAVGIGGKVLNGLIKALVFYRAELAVFQVKYYGPDGVNLLLPENFGDIETAQEAAEDYLVNMFIQAIGQEEAADVL